MVTGGRRPGSFRQGYYFKPTVLTINARLAKRFFEEVQAGTIWINDPLIDNYSGPFGGMKMSGNTRELGHEGLESFLETKHVHWDFGEQLKDFWHPYGRSLG